MSRITQKMGYVSPLGKKSFFVKNDESLVEEIELQQHSNDFKIKARIVFPFDERAYRRIRVKPAKDDYIFLYASKDPTLKIIDRKVSKLSHSGIVFEDLLDIFGLTMSKNLVKKVEVDNKNASLIIDKLIRLLEIDTAVDFPVRNNLIKYVHSFVEKNPSDYKYTPPNEMEIVWDLFTLCIKIGSHDVSEMAGFIADELLLKFASYVRELKFGEERWNPNVATLQYDANTPEDAIYNPIFDKFHKVHEGIAIAMDSLYIKDIQEIPVTYEATGEDQTTIPILLQLVVNITNRIMQWVRNFLIATIKKVNSTIADVAKKFNAFVVGFINGIIDFIANIIQAIGVIISLINYESRKALIEAIQKFINEFEWSKVKKLIGKELTKLFAFTQGDEPYKNAYEFGTFIPKIIELILDVIGLVKGAAKLATSIYSIIKKIPEAIRKANNVLNNLYRALVLRVISRALLEALQKKGIHIEVRLIPAGNLSANPVKFFEGKWVIVRNKNGLELNRFRNETDANKYLQKLNNDKKFLDSELARIGSFENVKKLYVQRRKTFHTKGQAAIEKLWLKKVKEVFLNKKGLTELLTKHLDEFPALIKGYNQAEFKTIIKSKGKIVDEVDEFSMSGPFGDTFKKRFGTPPDWQLPKNTIDVFSDYDDFLKFVQDAFDFDGIPRINDSEIKYIYNFLKKHLHRGDEFIIETSNIFKTCGSCTREFMMLEDLVSSMGKKVTFIVRSNKAIKGFSKITETYPDMKSIIRKYEKLYNKNKKK